MKQIIGLFSAFSIVILCCIHPATAQTSAHSLPSGAKALPSKSADEVTDAISDDTPTVPQEQINQHLAEMQSWVTKGRLQLNEKQTDAAVVTFKHALSLDAAYTSAYLGLIDAYTVKGDLKNAAQTYRTLLYPAPTKNWGSSESSNPVTLMRFALVLNQIGEKDEALTVYRKGLSHLNYVDGKPRSGDFPRTGDFPLLIDTTFDGRDSENIYTPARFEAAARTALAMELWTHSQPEKQAEANKQLTRAIAANPHFGPARLYLAMVLKNQVHHDARVTPKQVSATFDTAAQMVHGVAAKTAVKKAREAY